MRRHTQSSHPVCVVLQPNINQQTIQGEMLDMLMVRHVNEATGWSSDVLIRQHFNAQHANVA